MPDIKYEIEVVEKFLEFWAGAQPFALLAKGGEKIHSSRLAGGPFKASFGLSGPFDCRTELSR